MAPGLLAELSPNEETTLFRIANLGDCVHDLRETSVARLITLALVEKRGACLVLTDLGSSPVRQGRQPKRASSLAAVVGRHFAPRAVGTRRRFNVRLR